ncbi:MAG: phosphoenolpyruvate synthase [Nitrospirota bacterium]|nr:phosphoenolpyruvate synthase [Nitrospirota bacterium]
MAEGDFIRFFDRVSLDDVPLVGGKGASLGELYRVLSPMGVPVPNGFCITAPAYRKVLEGGKSRDKQTLGARIAARLEGLNTSDVADLARRGEDIRAWIHAAPVPEELTAAITAAYRKLEGGQAGGQKMGQDAACDVAVRSSATAEDLPTASFAGQHDSFLHIRGDAAVLDAVRRCWASLYTDRAIAYRVHQGFEHEKVALSVTVQRMVRSDHATSGVIFTLDTDTGFDRVVLVTAAYGLGENVVKGTVSPDEFYVFKDTLEVAPSPVIRRFLGAKQERMVYEEGGAVGGATTVNQPVAAADRERFCLTDAEVVLLARYAMQVERHYTQRSGSPLAMDLEWARDGDDGRFYIIQARGETVHSRKRTHTLKRYHLLGSGRELVRGAAVGGGIVTGRARVIRSADELAALLPGEILVAEMTDPAWEPIMKTAAGIVTDRGGRTCHAAIVSRELGLTAVVGSGDGSRRIASGEVVTVCAAGGGEGVVYAGAVPFRVEEVSLAPTARPKTRIMMNVGNPDKAFEASFLPNDGVGLARLEFIISNAIRVHPQALLHPEQVKDGAVRAEIARAARGYATPAAFFVARLAEGVGTIGAAFYPKPVIVRLSDFKSNEYAELVGGRGFEPVEENPMLGFRGAARYVSDAYREGFALECRAIRTVREEMGLTNVQVMIPFVRTVAEGLGVLDRMARNGLKRGEHGLLVYLMCEIPANVILAEEFLTHFDGFSIGSNDLTQLTLGVDRDSPLVAGVFDERNEAVKRLISQVIRTARRMGRHIGICGQAPSDYPDFAEFLVREGIESMSLNPDSVLAITRRVLEVEAALEGGGTRASGTSEKPGAARR